jgi:hypothetical protein
MRLEIQERLWNEGKYKLNSLLVLSSVGVLANTRRLGYDESVGSHCTASWRFLLLGCYK